MIEKVKGVFEKALKDNIAEYEILQNEFKNETDPKKRNVILKLVISNTNEYGVICSLKKDVLNVLESEEV